MTLVVVDASAALAWALRSQATAASDRMIAASDQYEFIAPAIFPFEVYNVLVGLSRRGLLTDGAFQEAAAALEDLEVELEPPVQGAAVPTLAIDARMLGLSLFDACYFQLAVAEGCGIATRDAGLIAVCGRADVPVFDLRD